MIFYFFISQCLKNYIVSIEGIKLSVYIRS